MDTFKVKFTPDKLAAFMAAMKQAEDAGEETFQFQGRHWLVAYAKYLAEYLKGIFWTGRTEYKSNK